MQNQTEENMETELEVTAFLNSSVFLPAWKACGRKAMVIAEGRTSASKVQLSDQDTPASPPKAKATIEAGWPSLQKEKKMMFCFQCLRRTPHPVIVV